MHGYAYDVLCRLTDDTVTTLGTDVDGAVRRIRYEYDPQGNAFRFTSFSDTAGTGVVNQVQRGYNGLGQLIVEYQAHGAAMLCTLNGLNQILRFNRDNAINAAKTTIS